MQRVKRIPSRVLARPQSNARTPNPTTQNMEVHSDSESEDGEGERQGLGLIFYDHKGRGSRSKIYKFDDELRSTSASPSLVSRAASSPNSGKSTSAIPPFNDPDLEQPPLALIERLLEENYRGQAETFVRISSRSSNRSQSTDNRSASCSSGSSAVRNTTFDTPSRQPTRGESFAALRRSQSLRSPCTRTHTLSRSFSSSRVVFEPYRDQSGPVPSKQRRGFSSVEQPPDSPSTYGHRVFAVPEHASPGSLKTRSRSSSVTRGPLYFTEEERQAIADLIRSNPRHCERHPNCTDCTNLEYAYHENKAMATSLPPEERQKIINNNRSLRNIKNVCGTSGLMFPLLTLNLGT
jgi:LAS seventeen-binding protein 1/2